MAEEGIYRNGTNHLSSFLIRHVYAKNMCHFDDNLQKKKTAVNLTNLQLNEFVNKLLPRLFMKTYIQLAL